MSCAGATLVNRCAARALSRDESTFFRAIPAGAAPPLPCCANISAELCATSRHVDLCRSRRLDTFKRQKPKVAKGHSYAAPRRWRLANNEATMQGMAGRYEYSYDYVGPKASEQKRTAWRRVVILSSGTPAIRLGGHTVRIPSGLHFTKPDCMSGAQM